MSVFNVELKKVVDDSYDIEMGYRLEDQLVEDLETGLLGKIRKFAVITDSNVQEKKVRPDRRRRRLKMPCWKKGSAEIVL